ncbi:4091_t:CDS:2 [Ambispora leptoticha]|uniref:4091_t:CDS:1 n=1 Tax=Ambispora leptoticha TaxID=144679 RepID=A0A9N9BTD4_9GLOM|nr:4091_t:CDS:2 [Ambispora leptoticha]
MPSTPTPTPSLCSSEDEEIEITTLSNTVDTNKSPVFDSTESSDLIDHEVFDQLVEMDDDDDDFSRSIILNYFDQAESTFGEMDKALKSKDLNKLSQLGHFLKGSSAAIGLIKVKASCEKLQHYGNLKDETGTKSISEELALRKIEPLLKGVKEEYKEAEDYLRRFYRERETSS